MSDRKGFTLIELIAVVVIMAIIALLATPNIISLLEKGKKEEFVADAKEFVSKATYMYKSEKFNSSGTSSYFYKNISEIKGVNTEDLNGPWGEEYTGGVTISTSNGTRSYRITLSTRNKSKTYSFNNVDSKNIDLDHISQN